MEFLPRIGPAVLYPVYRETYERNVDPLSRDRSQLLRAGNLGKGLMISWFRDFSRWIDYLETRADIDFQKLGAYNFSGFLLPVFTALDDRIKARVMMANGPAPRGLPPEYDPLHFAPRSKTPTLMIGERWTSSIPWKPVRCQCSAIWASRKKTSGLPCWIRGTLLARLGDDQRGPGLAGPVFGTCENQVSGLQP